MKAMNAPRWIWALLFTALFRIGETQGKESTYALSELRNLNDTQAPPALAVSATPLLNYDLPGVPISFRLNLRNQSDRMVRIDNPLWSLQLMFTAGPKVIDIPRRSYGGFVHTVPPREKYETIAPITFRKAVVEGQEITEERDSYEIKPGSALDIVFECQSLISDRILEALKDSKEKVVEVSLHLTYINRLDSNDSRFVTSKSIPLAVPKP